VIGRVLDAAAKSLQVTKCEITKGWTRKTSSGYSTFEGGRLLEFNEKVGSALVSGTELCC